MAEHERQTRSDTSAETSPDPTPETDQIPVQTDVRVPPQAGNMPVPATSSPEPGAVAPPPPTETRRAKEYEKLRRTRFSGLWVAVTAAAVVLLVLLVFIIENGTSVDIAFFGAHGHLPLGVALLLAAICGVLVVAVPGYGRILQLRRALRRSAAPAPAGSQVPDTRSRRVDTRR